MTLHNYNNKEELQYRTALTSDELDAMLAKIKAYEAAAPGDWMRKVVLLADTPDTGGNFRASSESLTPLLGAYDTQKIYRGVKTDGETRDLLLDELQAGAVLLNYLGHGGIDRLSNAGLLLSDDVSDLNNGERLFILTSLTCNVARFEIPGFASLAESLVLDADGVPGGGDDVLLDSTATDTSGNYRFTGLVAGDYFAVSGLYDFVFQVYTLLGDPASVIQRAGSP